MNILVNGKFLGRPLTGVDRYAYEISMRIGVRLSEHDRILEIAVPSQVSATVIEDARISNSKIINVPGFKLSTAWEQLILPFIRPHSMLLSLCNIGPVFRSNQCVMIADAQFITQPSSYSWKFRTWYRFALPLLARRAKVLVTISEYSKRELEDLGVVPRGRLRVVPCGVDHVLGFTPDTSILDRLGLVPNSFVLMIGSRARHKNVAPVLNALDGNLPPGVKIVLVGGANSRVFAEDGISASEDLIVAGRVSDNELAALYKNANVFLFPSLTEGFGLPPAEAMALGCPVIASNLGAIPEVMGDACLYVNPTEGTEWVAAVEQVCENPEVRTALIERGLMQATNWTWDKAATILLDELKQAR